MTQSLVVREEKCFVSNDWTADRCPEVISDEMTGAHFVKRAGIESIIPQEFINGAVYVIRSTPRHNIDLTSTGSSHFSGIATGLDLELLNSVRRRTEIQRIEGRIGIGGAIEKEIVCVRPISPHAYGGPLARTPIERIHLPCLCTMTRMGTRNGEDEIDEHASIKRQILDRGRLNDFSCACICLLQELVNVCRDIDGAGDGSELQLHIKVDAFSYFDTQVS